MCQMNECEGEGWMAVKAFVFYTSTSSKRSIKTTDDSIIVIRDTLVSLRLSVKLNREFQ
jgi:hypothetical protein